jgi:nucleoid-associated protein YgaU
MASVIKKIGHASISEHGTITGTAGDSTGKEVYIKENYKISNIDPYIVLRPKNAAIAAGSVAACIAGCENNHIGYSQSSRNTLYHLAKDVNFDLSAITSDCNTDCSAFMTVCAIAGGARITYGSNAPATSNMRTRFSQSGDYEVLTSTKYTTQSDYLKPGDILVHEGTHTIMVLENGNEGLPEVVDDTEPVSSMQSYNILTKVSDLRETSATITTRVVKQLNETESKFNNTNWSYILEYKKLPDGTTTKKDIVDNKVSLTNLTEDTCYLYRVIVKKDDADLFCSAHKTFNTLKVIKNTDTLSAAENRYIDAIYLKTDKGYQSVFAHIKNKGV